MSRRNELEADRCGIYFSGEGGFNPESAITMQLKLSGGHKNNNDNTLQGYTSTHPKGEKRVKTAEKEAKKFREQTDDDLWAKKRKEEIQHILELFKKAKEDRNRKKGIVQRRTPIQFV